MDAVVEKPYRAAGMGLDQYGHFAVRVTMEHAPDSWRSVLERHGLRLNENELSEFVTGMIRAIDQNIQSDFRTMSSGKAGVPGVRNYAVEEPSELGGNRAALGYSLPREAAPFHAAERITAEALGKLKADPEDLNALNDLKKASGRDRANWKNAGEFVEDAIDGYVQQHATERVRFMEVIGGRELSDLKVHPTFVPTEELAGSARTTASGHPLPAGSRTR